MLTQNVWDDKAQRWVKVDSWKTPAASAAASRPVLDHVGFHLVFLLLAVPLYWLLPRAFEVAGAAWRNEYLLWAAVPVCVLTVLARFLARKIMVMRNNVRSTP